MESARNSPTLVSLFDRDVAARECNGVVSLDALHAKEAELVARAVPGRKTAFAAGRLCAAAALRAIAAEAGPVLWDDARAPIWPNGVVGSITHTEGFCGAVVVDSKDCGGIGIDAERRAGVHEELWQQILTPGERKRLLACDPIQRRGIATIIFSAKEAFYKAQYQVTGSWLGFEDAEVRLVDGEFTLELLVDVGILERGKRVVGKWAVLPEVVVAGVALPSARSLVRQSHRLSKPASP